MNGKLRIALIGAGSMGTRWAGVIHAAGGSELRMVCDNDTEKARVVAHAFHAEPIHDWKIAAASNSIDAAVIALPHAFLAPASLDFLRNGKHVLCEKPAGIHPAEVQRVTALAHQRKKCYMIGFNHRYHDGFLRARRYYDAGMIGDILFIRAHYGFGGRKGYTNEWRLNKRISGGGELIDQGVHMIDLARWFLGDVPDVLGFAQNIFWGGEADDNAFVILKNRRGQAASLHVSLMQWNPSHHFEIYGTKGFLAVRGLGRKYNGGEHLVVGRRGKDFKITKEKVIVCDPNADRSLARELREFIGAIHEKREPAVSGGDAVKALVIVHKIYAGKK